MLEYIIEYIHILLDIEFLKLSLSSARVSLLNYFKKEDYKLFNRKTSTVFKSQDTIFEEEVTYLVIQLKQIVFSNNNNSFNKR